MSASGAEDRSLIPSWFKAVNLKLVVTTSLFDGQHNGQFLTAQMAEWYRASVSGVVDSGLIPSWVKPMALKLVFTASLLDAQHYKRTVWRASLQVYLLCRWERHLAGIFHLGVVDKWLATLKRARTAH